MRLLDLKQRVATRGRPGGMNAGMPVSVLSGPESYGGRTAHMVCMAAEGPWVGGVLRQVVSKPGLCPDGESISSLESSQLHNNPEKWSRLRKEWSGVQSQQEVEE